MDLAILVPLQEEFRQLFPRIEHICKSDDDPRTNRSFFTFSLPGKSGHQYECVTTFVGDMGKTEAASLTRKLIDAYSPSTLVLLGIAGSLSPSVRLCDVVVADQINDYLARARAEPGKEHTVEFGVGGKAYRPDVKLLNVVKSFEFKHPEAYKRLKSESQADVNRLDSRIREDLVGSGLLGKEFEYHCGPIASGDIVAASTDFCRWLLSRDRKYRAIEMEAAGVMGEIYESAGAERVMVLRGISDCSDERKERLDRTSDGLLREIALRNAIRFLWALFDVEAFEHSPEVRIHEKSQTPEVPKNIEQAQAIFKRLDQIESRELKEIILILELMEAEISHFQRPDFLQRIDELSTDPTVMTEGMVKALKEMRDLVGEEGLTWKENLVLRSAASFLRKKVRDGITAETGLTENLLWKRLMDRERSIAAAFLICVLYDIKAGAVSKKLEPRIRREFEIRNWPLPIA